MSPASDRSFRIWLPFPEICTRTLGGLCTSARPGGSCTFRSTSKLVVTGCWSCTATYSISARNSAAPLIGQLRVMSWSRLARIEQPADQVFVDGCAPIGGADHLFHDHAVTIDHEALGHAGRLVDASNGTVTVVQDLKCESQVLRELLDDRGVVLIDADGHEAKIAAGQPAVQLLHGRHLDLARRAPRRPDVEEHHLAPVVLDFSGRAARQLHRVEFRRGRAHLEQIDLRPQLDRERDAEDRRRQDARDERPLLPIRHAVTMQRRRSSCTSRAGSPPAKMALPATNVSAPAW